ncbi:MAG: HepT-like ribonuclease domain-containing protein [Nanoarchaeota archaeon]
MKERILEKIEDIEKYLNELEEIVPIKFDDFKLDLKAKAACERYFEKIVESAVDLAFLLIKESKLRSALEDTDAFAVLAESHFIDVENLENHALQSVVILEHKKILRIFCSEKTQWFFLHPKNERLSNHGFQAVVAHRFFDVELSERLQDAKSMRNLIVHQYEIIENIRVYEAVKDKLPQDIKEFLHCIKEAL